MRKIILTLISIPILLGCGDGYKKSESGLEYKFINKSDGVKPKPGDVLEMNLSYKNEKGQVLWNTSDSGGPVPILYQEERFTNNGSLEEIIMMVSEGDSIEFKIPAQKVFEETFNATVPDSIPRNSLITFNLGVVRVITAEAYKREQAASYMENAKIQFMLGSKQMEEDAQTIDNYLASKNIIAQKTETGLRYVINQEGTGEKAKPGDIVSIDYIGTVVDGRVFDTSIKEVAERNNNYNVNREPYEPYEFTLGLGEVIYGWDEGISLLNKGAKATIYVPSLMGYGPQAMSEVIVENSILIFELELVNIKEN